MKTTAETTKAENFSANIGTAKLERVLVVISPDLIVPEAPKDSALIRRAIALAKATGCELELFHVCHDRFLTPALFLDESELRREQENAVNRDATLMAELVLRLKTEGVTLRHDTRWDAPRADAILRKINQSKPDLVMKQSREHRYVMGLIENTDWDLIRQSPAHLWFVTEDGEDKIDRLITAVGDNDDASEMIDAADYDVFSMAKLIAEGFGAENFPVHAFQVPQRLGTYAAYSQELGGISHLPAGPISVLETRREVAKKHARSIEAFARYFQMDPNQVRLAQGHPADVIPALAENLDASLIVMAARNLSRWQRLFHSVTAEPVLADAPCDVVFIKDKSETSIPEAGKRPTSGIPAYNLEQVVTDPEKTFGSPQRLAQTAELSPALRKRLLQIWEQDIRAQMAEENEGGAVVDTNANLLDALHSAIETLAEDTGRKKVQPMTLTH